MSREDYLSLEGGRLQGRQICIGWRDYRCPRKSLYEGLWGRRTRS